MKQLVTLFSCFLLLYGQAEATTCSGYANSGTFTIHPPAASVATMTNFPITIFGAFSNHLNSAGGMVHASGFDQCFSDTGNTTTYPVQMAPYDATNGVNEVTLIPSIAAYPTLTDFKVWWGKSGATDPSSTTVWTSNYFQVFRLPETTFNYLDSTSNGSNLTTGTASTRAAGPNATGYVQTFAGAQSDHGPSGQTVGSQTFSLSALFKTSTSAAQIIVDNRNSSFIGVALYLNASNNAQCDASTDSPFTGTSIIGSVDLHDGAYHHIACTLGSASLKLYVDGVSAATPVTQASGSTPFPSSATFDVGNVQNLAGWTGQLGEVRGFNGLRSPSEVAAEASNLLTPGTFLTFAASGGSPADVVIVPRVD